jgi:hypothetical protein
VQLHIVGGDLPVLTFDRANDILLRWARKRAGEAVGLPLGLALLYSLKGACTGAPR